MSLASLLIPTLGTVLCAQLTTTLSTASRYMLPFITLFVFQTILSIVYYGILYPLYLSPLRHLPSPKQSAPWHRFTKEPGPRTLCKWVNEVPNDGLIRYFGLFNREQILLTRPQGCKEVLQSQAYSFIKFPWALEVMGQVTGSLGLLVAPPEKHKIDRKLMQPAFKTPYIKSLYPTFWSEGTKFLIAVEKSLAGSNAGVVDIGKMLHYVTLDIVTLTGFGGSVHAVDDPESAQIKQYRDVFSAKRSHISYRLSAMTLPYWIYRRLPVSARYEIESAVSSVHASILPLIQARRKSTLVSKSEGEKDSDAHGKGDIIATLLRSGNTFSDAYLLDQAVGLIIAGQETTAVAVSFALYLLSSHPDVQMRLRAEIRANLISPDPNGPGHGLDTGLDVNSDIDIDNLPYLTAVCNEVLRIYAPVPDTRRLTTAPNTSIERTHIPVGTVVTVAPWVIHHSKAVWGPNAAKFDPERWLVRGSGSKKQALKIDPTGGSGDPFAVMTFTYGARACIGERFARAEMATLVAQLVGRFEWKFKGIGPRGDKEMKLAFGVTLATVGGGMTMEARKIEGW